MATARSNRTGRTVAAGIAVAGAVGLGLLAVPAGAGAQPQLPPVDPEELVRSVLAAEPGPFAGTVELDNALGLPALPGVPQAGQRHEHGAHLDRRRPPRPRPAADRLRRTHAGGGWGDVLVVELRRPHRDAVPAGRAPSRTPGPPTRRRPPGRRSPRCGRRARSASTAPPRSQAARPTSWCSRLPRPSARCCARYGWPSTPRSACRCGSPCWPTGPPIPALQLGFTDIKFGPQDPELFTLHPAARCHRRGRGAPRAGTRAGRPVTPSRRPWATAGTLSCVTAASRAGRRTAGGRRPTSPSWAAPITGPWGSGRLITTAVASVIVTDDGRVAAGRCPSRCSPRRSAR